MTVNLTRQDGFAFLEIARPEALNALNFETIERFGAAVNEVSGWSDVRALIITGAGEKAFCAGADIKELSGRSVIAEREGSLLGQRTFALLDRCPVPSIAAINGYAFGGGMEIALACTFRIAHARAKMGLPEIKLGLIPGYGGTQRLPRLIGEARALELILTGRTVAADEALALGMVNAVTEDDVVEAAKTFAAGFAGYSRCALTLAREAIVRGMQTTLAEGLAIEADLSTVAYRTGDAGEGIAAFVEKRKPNFTDR